MLDAAFNRSPVTKEKSPMLVVRDIRHAIYGKKNKIYYQPGRRLLPDFIMAKLPYGVVDRLMVKIMKRNVNN